MLEADREAERMLPKAVSTTLALSAHHLVRARRMRPEVRRELRTGIRSLLARLPRDQAETAIERLSGPRRRALARVLREAGRA